MLGARHLTIKPLITYHLATGKPAGKSPQLGKSSTNQTQQHRRVDRHNARRSCPEGSLTYVGEISGWSEVRKQRTRARALAVRAAEERIESRVSNREWPPEGFVSKPVKVKSLSIGFWPEFQGGIQRNWTGLRGSDVTRITLRYVKGLLVLSEKAWR